MKKYRNIFLVMLVMICIFSITACKNEEKKDESKTDYMVLVNKQSKLPDDWESRIELVDVYTGLDETYQVEKKTAEAYAKLRDDLRENDHVIIELDSTYRIAIDVKIVKEGKIIDDNDEMTSETEIFSKVHAKLAKYGFILRYPKGKEDITGYGAEVWHFRYIDNHEVANEIMNKGLTFEEYLQEKNK